MDYLKRTEMLIGKEKTDKLNASTVAVFGIGGVGSFAAEALVRSGIGRIVLCDNDVVSVSNINRQLIALSSTVGRLKTSVMKERMEDIREDVAVEELPIFFSGETADKVDFSKIDYIIDAIDTVSSKLLLIKIAKEKNIPIISCMGTGNKLSPERFEVADIKKTSVCPLARVMRRELKQLGITSLKVVYSKEEPRKTYETQEDGKRNIPGSISFCPSVAGLIAAGEVICDLAEIER